MITEDTKEAYNETAKIPTNSRYQPLNALLTNQTGQTKSDQRVYQRHSAHHRRETKGKRGRYHHGCPHNGRSREAPASLGEHSEERLGSLRRLNVEEGDAMDESETQSRRTHSPETKAPTNFVH